MTDEQFERESEMMNLNDDRPDIYNEKKNESTKEEIKEREELIWILFTLRQDADIEFTREYVQNMTNKQIKKEIINEKDNVATLNKGLY
jgi:hypothetical protein